MTAWLKSLQAELKKISGETAVEPDTEVGKHDHVVGEADLDMRKLYSLLIQKKKLSVEAAAAAMVVGGKGRKAKIEEAAKFDDQFDTLKAMFWTSCRFAFPELWAKPSIGVRKGWKVVWSDPEVQTLDIPLGAVLGLGALEELLRRGSEGDPEAMSGRPSRLN